LWRMSGPDEVDDVFGDVSGVVADALEVFRTRMSFERRKTTLESPSYR